MTIKELMKQLEKLPQDTEVIAQDKEVHIIRKVEFVRWNDNIKFVVLHTKED